MRHDTRPLVVPRDTPTQARWPRRAVLRLGGAAALGAVVGTTPLLTSAARAAGQPIEPDAGSWQTWVLASGDALRLPPPPDERTTRAELAQLRDLADQRDAAALDLINYWDSGSPGYRWDELALALTLARGIGGGRAARVMALLSVAICDATIAAWDSKYAYGRPRPTERDPRLSPALPVPASPSYPCEHAAAAGAAATVLAYLFPDSAATFAGATEEAGHARQLAGLAYPSDTAAGLDLGRRVADLVIARARADGSDKPWDGKAQTGPDKWFPAAGTTPAEVTTGTWQPWVLARNDQLRPAPRAAVGSAQLSQELAELKTFARTNATNVTASHWEYYGGARSHLYWHTQLGRTIAAYRLDANPPRAARAYALLSAAHYDAFVAVGEAKYAYWAIRPFQLDPALTTVFATPNHPSYPAAHGTVSTANATVLAYLFPREAGLFLAQADEAAASRLWAGIHFRSDIAAGQAQGRALAQLVIDRARQDGAG